MISHNSIHSSRSYEIGLRNRHLQRFEFVPLRLFVLLVLKKYALNELPGAASIYVFGGQSYR